MAQEDREYLNYIRGLRCACEGHGECIGPVQAHHATGKKGIGTKNHDHRTIPLCSGHHTERHSLSGYFRDFHKADIREWEERLAGECRRQYLGLGDPSSF